MADYPSNVKTFTNLNENSMMDDSGLEGDVVINRIQDEVSAIETELGTDPKTITEATSPSASPSSVAEFLDMVATQLKAISGASHWYSAVETSLSSVVTSAASIASSLSSHTSDTSNPHSVTKSQVGLGNVSNVAQVPLSYLDTDGTLAANSDSKVASQKAAKTYTDKRIKVVGIQVFGSGTDVTTGDGAAFYRIPLELNGMNLIGVAISAYTAGTTGTTDVQIRNKTQTADILSTKLTIDSGETDSSTAATAAVIDTSEDDVATGDIIAIDIDATSTTKAKGLYIEMRFQLP